MLKANIFIKAFAKFIYMKFVLIYSPILFCFPESDEYCLIKFSFPFDSSYA